MTPQILRCYVHGDMAKVPAHKLKALVKESKKMPPHGGEHDESEDKEPEHDEEGDDADEPEDKEDKGDGGGNPGKDKGGDGGEGGGDDVDQMVATAAGKVESGETDDALMELVDGYDPELDGNPPEWVGDEGTWNKAKAAVEKKWEDYDEPWAVVAHVYQNMGGAQK